jgi:hypothetical protein
MGEFVEKGGEKGGGRDCSKCIRPTRVSQYQKNKNYIKRNVFLYN